MNNHHHYRYRSSGRIAGAGWVQGISGVARHGSSKARYGTGKQVVIIKLVKYIIRKKKAGVQGM